jgi:hypothetical protein
VTAASSRGGSGSPYDTSADVREVLARIKAPGEAPDASTITLPRRLVDKYSGFLDRLIEEHHSGRNRIVPSHLTSPSHSEFGVPTRESTITWGATIDLSFDHNVPGSPEPVFPIQSTQLLHVHRPRPTTHTVLVAIALGADWSGENQTTFTIFYSIGVGQGKLTIPKNFVLTVGQLVAASNTVPIVDINTYPFQSLQVGVQLTTLSPANNGRHGITVAGFVAPVVD